MSEQKGNNTPEISVLDEDDFSELAIPHPAIVMSTPPENATTANTSSALQGLKAAINNSNTQTLPPLQPIGGKQPVQPVATKPTPLQPIGGKQPVQPAAVKPTPMQPIGGKQPVQPAAVKPTPPQPITNKQAVQSVAANPTPLQPIGGKQFVQQAVPAKTTPMQPMGGQSRPVTQQQATIAQKPSTPTQTVSSIKSTTSIQTTRTVTPTSITPPLQPKAEPVAQRPVAQPIQTTAKPATPVAPVQTEVKPVVPEPVKVEEVKPVAPEPAKVAEVQAEEKPTEESKTISILADSKINNKKVPMIAPPAMLGILGGGQLGRFFAMAAKRMGYQVTVLDPDPDAPAAAFADEHICAAYDDEAALEKLAQCAAVTTEFENVNAQAMIKLAQKTRVTPAGELVAIAQNRINEKSAIRSANLPVVPYQAIRSREDLNANTKQLLPGILKTATLGYDGKGQRSVKTQTGLLTCLSSLAKDGPYILEKELDLTTELSVIVCRLDNNVVVTFPPAENIHDNGILAFSIVPARLPEELLKRAEVMAKHLAEKLDYVGVLAVEMFVVGEKQQLVVNEIAPRPHNSGHYTLDACVSDQFQQQVRIMCGLPPSRTSLIHPCCMVNLLGDIWGEDGKEPDWSPLLKNPDTFLHLYGKKQARPGRKMGHFTVFAETADAAYEKAQNLFTSVCLG